jgi:hypothetical protein
MKVAGILPHPFSQVIGLQRPAKIALKVRFGRSLLRVCRASKSDGPLFKHRCSQQTCQLQYHNTGII